MTASQIAGTYEYIKPGGDKMTQQLIFRPDHTVSFTEHIDSTLEIADTTGEGTWEVRGEQLTVILSKLHKTMKMKRSTMIPGIESGTSTAENITIPLTVKEIAQAPKTGLNKWRRVS